MGTSAYQHHPCAQQKHWFGRKHLHQIVKVFLGIDSYIRFVKRGSAPRSVSAPSRKPSAPSSTALATSVASARVGRGVAAIVSHSRVTSTGLPSTLQPAITYLHRPATQVVMTQGHGLSLICSTNVILYTSHVIWRHGEAGVAAYHRTTLGRTHMRIGPTLWDIYTRTSARAPSSLAPRPSPGCRARR